MSNRLWLLLLVCAGCGAGSGSTESFLTALPSRQTLEVSGPSGGGAALRGASTALLGETAGLYVLTRQTTAQVNGIVGGPLDALSTIARTPPAATGADGAAWGPLTDALSPVVWRLVVSRLAPGEHAFRLDVRPKSGSDADFQPFLQGASQGPGPAGPGQGTFSVDLDLAHRLDPVANPAAGQIVAAWNSGGGNREIHVHLDGVHLPSEPTTTADLAAVLPADGSGALAFDVEGNLVGGAAALELGQVGSRWNAAGAGRADAEVQGGDSGAGVLLTECWDASFARVFFRGVGGDGGAATEGDESACVFAEPLR
ncbi:MAG TPA: hypothetical protein VK454_02080 [Myxococcaceae bacterium]|nr:hypothetical protein [Myxococcaceae bacterium]